MSKEQFIKLMNVIVKQHNQLKDLYNDIDDLFSTCDRLIDVTNLVNIVDVISEIVGDTDNWIYWYIYENDCGKRSGTVIDTDGLTVPCETIEDIWNLIMMGKGE